MIIPCPTIRLLGILYKNASFIIIHGELILPWQYHIIARELHFFYSLYNTLSSKSRTFYSPTFGDFLRRKNLDFEPRDLSLQTNRSNFTIY